ncbi:MAG: lysine--tRNA ligase [Chloracidobacterium sp. CP2_5A]|nr:MAG: lysine--tRNA ligase [Chloracidobacterium sp. CP2_5A]
MEENEYTRQRRQNLADIAALGFPTYPAGYDRTHSVSEIVATYGERAADALEAEAVAVRVAGRIQAINLMGKAAFIRFTDGATTLQAYLRKNELPENEWLLFKRLDLGDFIGVAGKLFRTKTGELSVHAEQLAFLSKAIIPPPDKRYGLHDIELRYRRRYADLMTNRDARATFVKRSRMIQAIRRFFDARGYLEVETPMLHPIASGATARPFATHHNALNMPLYARIAPELYLKRLIVGGFEKVYEINRNFRNEGLSTRHNPEFTMLEFYEAYATYEDLMTLTEELLTEVVACVCEGETIPYGEATISFARPWRRLTMQEAIVTYWPTEDRPTVADLADLAGVNRALERLRLPVAPTAGYGKRLGELFEQVAEPNLIQPTFITRFPKELSPLARTADDDPSLVDRFELFIGGMECANAFSELNDPDEQRRRFEQQLAERARGDDEAMPLDEDFIRALAYGMPPTAGEGVGIDRLAMLLTNQRSIRDVILFPHLRPEAPETPPAPEAKTP